MTLTQSTQATTVQIPLNHQPTATNQMIRRMMLGDSLIFTVSRPCETDDAGVSVVAVAVGVAVDAVDVHAVDVAVGGSRLALADLRQLFLLTNYLNN